MIHTLIPSTGKNVNNIIAGFSALLAQRNEYGGTIHYRFEDYSLLANDHTWLRLLRMAELLGITVKVMVRPAVGIRLACDELIQAANETACSGDFYGNFALMLGDDVIVEPGFFLALAQVQSYLSLTPNKLIPVTADKVGFVCGAKMDVLNDVGFPDFSTAEVPPGRISDYCSTHLRAVRREKISLVKCRALDTGCALLNIHAYTQRYRQLIRFSSGGLNESAIDRYGGEDTLLGARYLKNGFHGFFTPDLRAWHLNSPQAQFGSSRCRIENVYNRVVTLAQIFKKANLPLDCIRDAFPWTKDDSGLGNSDLWRNVTTSGPHKSPPRKPSKKVSKPKETTA